MARDLGATARQSPIEGWGLYALRDFAAGDIIQRVNIIREITDAAPLRPERDEHPHHCAYPDDKMVLYGFPDRHMNHSCDPNAWYDYADYEEMGAPLVRARRAIAKDEEVTVDYLINNPGGNSWPCACGAARCRGETGISFFTLPEAIQQEYRPLLAPWFVWGFLKRFGDGI
ncbi:MAG: SET domain-containing protein [Alphaproteobacteria bacterium]